LRGEDSWSRPRAAGAAPQARTNGCSHSHNWFPSLGTPCGPEQRVRLTSPGRREQGPPPTLAHRRPGHVGAVPLSGAGTPRGKGAGAGDGVELSRRVGLPCRDGAERRSVRMEPRPRPAKTRAATFRRRPGRREGDGERGGAGTTCDVLSPQVHSPPRAKGVPDWAGKWFSGSVCRRRLPSAATSE